MLKSIIQTKMDCVPTISLIVLWVLFFVKGGHGFSSLSQVFARQLLGSGSKLTSAPMHLARTNAHKFQI
jgi:hypothetical protein